MIGRLVRERGDRIGGRVVARQPLGAGGLEGRDREVGAIVLAHGDDRPRLRERGGQRSSERLRDLARGGCVAERLSELVPLPDLEPLGLLLPSRAQQSPADDAQHRQGRGADDHELEEETIAGRREHGRSGTVDHRRPARRLGVGVGNDVPARAVEAAGHR